MEMQRPNILVIEFEPDGLRERSATSVQELDGELHAPVTLIFADEEALRNQEVFPFPDDFHPVLNKDINGSFFFDYIFDEETDEITAQISWSCFKIKSVRAPSKYKWLQPSVFVKWDIVKSTIQVIFINLTNDPPAFDQLAFDQKAFVRHRIPTARKAQMHPFTWHALLAESVMPLYDKSVWQLRHLVRPMEKERDRPSAPSRTLPILHDIGRHIFHSTETLDVAENTIHNLVAEHKRFVEDYKDIHPPLGRGTITKGQQKLLFLAKQIHSLRTRSKSLAERLQNEINLAFNLVTLSENAVMKTIGVVTLLYLPGTFVSGIFGTNFFDYNAPSDSEWQTSGKFWLYWAVTIPLTMLTIFLWGLLHYIPKEWKQRIRGTLFRLQTQVDSA